MSSLSVINKATTSRRGNGLPFYKREAYIFSNWNEGFNSTDGLLQVPIGKVPTFQLWLPNPTLVSIVYKETKGKNVFTGTTFTPPNSSITVIPVVDAELGQQYIYESSDDGTLISPAPEGRWVIELTTNAAGKWYSEEFVTKACL